jgi:hypothetical protein
MDEHQAAAKSNAMEQTMLFASALLQAAFRDGAEEQGRRCFAAPLSDRLETFLAYLKQTCVPAATTLLCKLLAASTSLLAGVGRVTSTAANNVCENAKIKTQI